MILMPILTFTELLVVSKEHLQRVCHAIWNAYPSGHWFRPPFWDLLVLQLLRPDSSNLTCLYSTFRLEYPLVLSRFFCILWSLVRDQQRHEMTVPILNLPSCRQMIFRRRLCYGSRVGKCSTTGNESPSIPAVHLPFKCRRCVTKAERHYIKLVYDSLGYETFSSKPTLQYPVAMSSVENQHASDG